MPSPWVELATFAATVIPDDVSIHSTATDKLVPPALVIRPDEPWREPDRFCADLQHYVAVAVVTASTPQDGTDKLYVIHSALIENLPNGWGFVSVSGIVTDESTSTPLLASALRLTYRNPYIPEEES
jgi:hypothetical protein